MPGSSEVVIVGAGPAGAVTALLLARQGVDVLLLDRAAFPRPKPCGDCLSAGATGLLERLGLLAAVEAAGPARLDGWDIVSPSGRVASGDLGGSTALALERRVLDAVLLDSALAAGARFAQVTVRDVVRDAAGRVTGLTGRDPDGQPFQRRADLVVGADGLRSTMARRLGLVRRRPRIRKLSLTAHIHLPGTPLSRGRMHLLAGGCIGVAPVGAAQVNVTLVAHGAEAPRVRRLGAPAYFRTRLREARGLPAALADLGTGPLLASGPFDWPVRAAAVPGAALVGDAAGYYDPFTGQGIHHGLASAEVLAGMVAPALRSGDLEAALRRYAAAQRRLTRPARRLQQIIEVALARPARADRVLARLGRAPAVMDRIVAVTGNLTPTRSLLSPTLLSTLIFPPATESP